MDFYRKKSNKLDVIYNEENVFEYVESKDSIYGDLLNEMKKVLSLFLAIICIMLPFSVLSSCSMQKKEKFKLSFGEETFTMEILRKMLSFDEGIDRR